MANKYVFDAVPYNLKPKNMDKRISVFIEQLLPDMLKSIDSVEEAWFQIQVLHRHCDRLTLKHLFDWDKIPEEYDTKRFIKTLNKFFAIEWIKTAKVEKIGDGKAVNIYSGEKYLSVKIDSSGKYITINDIKIDILVKEGINNQLKICVSRLTKEQDEKIDKAVCEWIEKWEVKIKEKGLPKILPKKSPTPDTSKILGKFQDRRG